MGHWGNIIETIVVSWMSATLLAVGTVGFYRTPINPIFRIFLFGAALVLIMPGFVFDLIGVAFMGGLVIWQRAQLSRSSGSIFSAKN